MIVRDEAPTIGRCLGSVMRLIDRWTIVDTGSTDDTRDVVRACLDGVPGALHERPWRDFGTNRSEALALARPWSDYTLVIDADDVLECATDFAWPDLVADSYTFDIRDINARYRRPHLLLNALPWLYRGILHEFAACEGAGPPCHLSGLTIRRGHDGARRRDPETWRRDAHLLECALVDEPDEMLRRRYAFYLGNSWRDCEEHGRAIAAYLARAASGGWSEEVYLSLLWCGRLMAKSGLPLETALETLERAAATLPARAEALHEAALICRLAGGHARAVTFAERATILPMSPDALFVEPWIYQYGALDEFAVGAFMVGRFRDSLAAGLRALSSGAVPASEQARLLHNMRAALDRMPD